MTRARQSLAQRGILPALVAMAGLAFGLVPLAQGRLFFYWDNAHQHFSQTVSLHDGLRSGRIPQWDPAIGFGFPVAAEGQAALFHPVRVFLALVFSPPAAMMWEIGFCFALAGVSTYMFLREFRVIRWASVLGGVTMMFSTASVIFVRNYALHRSICLMPLGMLLAERCVRKPTATSALGFGVVLALQLLSGHPTMAMVTIVATSLYLAVRLLQRAWHLADSVPVTARHLTRAFSVWLPAIALGFGLAALQVIPMLLHTGDSIRRGGLTFEYAVSSVPADPGALVQVAFPYAFEQGDRLDTPTPQGQEINIGAFSNMYVGVLTLLLAWVAIWQRRRWPDPTAALAICAVIATAFAVGPSSPLFPALWSVPGVGSMRYPSRFLLLSSFYLACLAAIGVHHLVGLSRLRRRLTWLPPALLCGSGVVVLGMLLWLRRPEFRIGIAVSLGLWAGAALLVWLLMRARRARTLALVTIVVAASTDLLVLRSVADYASTYPIADAMSPSEPAKFVKDDADPFRVISLVSLESGVNRNDQFRNLVMANHSSVWGIDSADAWGSLFPLRYYMVREELVWELAHSPQSANKLAGFLGALNVKYAISPTPVELVGWEKVYQSEGSHVWKNPTVQPRAFLVGTALPEDLQFRPEWEDRANRRFEAYRQMVLDWFSRREDAQIVDHIMERSVDYRTTAVVDGRDWPSLPGSQPQFKVEDLTSPGETDSMRFRVRTNQPALMVISSSYAPGWEATVNGVAAEILRTNWIVQGLFVPAGESDVLLRYRAPGWGAGVAVSLLSILLVVGTLLLVKDQ